MIIKECKMPLKIEVLEALIRRLPPGHARQSAIQEDIKKIRAGYNGEYRVFNLLKALPEKDYLLFHDLRLSRFTLSVPNGHPHSDTLLPINP
ncbi:NERD domain-containing protein [Peribacillus muralis]|uniref:hypothetical protein n=1 Tax=Peribacillus muralis TaxID=264697 RepID=UPI001F4D5222|nr:hypothetical protein [Peribacillus muralis]MCK1991625.1 hypothetical protein [Peribacillus muralis]MCK2012184.1 hypothetical protein [Peribacillus muralis]